MHTAENNKNVFVEGDIIGVRGVPSKDYVYDLLAKRVVLLNDLDFKNAAQSLAFFACVRIVLVATAEANLINPKILVNKDDFIIEGEDYSDLIPNVVRHEVAELWTYVKKGYNLSRISPGNKQAHHELALRAEYDYAFEIGNALRLFQFFMHWSVTNNLNERINARFLEENKLAYRKAQARFIQRKKRKVQIS
jgi:hypothetical protein